MIPGAGSSSSRHEYQYTDYDVINGIEYWYQLEDVSYAGEMKRHGPISAIPKREDQSGNALDDFRLFPCHPNPFNSSTIVNYYIAENSHVTLTVFDLLGNLVVTLVDSDQKAGYYKISWDGMSSSNRTMGNGIYLYQLVTNKGSTSTQKTILLR